MYHLCGIARDLGSGDEFLSDIAMGYELDPFQCFLKMRTKVSYYVVGTLGLFKCYPFLKSAIEGQSKEMEDDLVIHKGYQSGGNSHLSA